MRSTKKKPDNVIDISGNVELVMKLAADKLDAGDHIGALSLMRRAETIEPENEEVMLAIAGTYFSFFSSWIFRIDRTAFSVFRQCKIT